MSFVDHLEYITEGAPQLLSCRLFKKQTFITVCASRIFESSLKTLCRRFKQVYSLNLSLLYHIIF